jgi:hypothetical protein
MNPRWIRRRTLVVLVLACLAMTAGTAAIGPDAFAAVGHAPAGAGAGAGVRDACPQQPGPFARYFTRYKPAPAAAGVTSTANLADVAGWGATDIAAAYRLPTGVAATGLVAVSIAYDAPNLEQDLNTYRAQYGLPLCTVLSGCLRKVNQNGAASPLPAVDFGWQIEETLDVSMVSAACPSCRILVVEANTNSYADLSATEDTAVRLGAQVVTNSHGGPGEWAVNAVRVALPAAGTRHCGVLRGQRVHRRLLPGRRRHGDRRGRHHIGPCRQRPWLDRIDMVTREQRVFGLRRQANLATRSKLSYADSRGCGRSGR